MYILISIIISILLSVIIIKNSSSKRYIGLCIAIISGSICFSILSPVFRSTLQNLTLIDKTIVVLFGSIFLLVSFIYLARAFIRFQDLKVLPKSVGTIVEGKAMVILIIISVLTITFASKSSPLYIFNDWCDPNCFFTVGRGMLNGKVLYRDLYDQKGPIIYFIHAFACLIDYDGFFGIYIIEILACFLYLFYSLKLVLLFTDYKIVPFIGILSAIVYSSVSLDKGDSCEELCLWCLVYGLYIGFRIIMKDSTLKNYELIMLGFVGSIVLWTKYLMMGFYIGWIIAICFFMIKEKQFYKLIYYFVMALIGVLICSCIVFLYFIKTNSLGDLFQAYFYTNLFAYEPGTNGSFLIGFGNLIFHTITKGIKNIFVSLLIVFSLVVTYKMKGHYFVFYTCCLCLTAFFLYFKGAYIYYSFCLGVFAPLGLILPYSILETRGLLNYNKSLIAGILLSYCLFMSFCPNIRYLGETKGDMVQYKFRDIIKQKSNPVILNYGFQDYGFYTVCGLVPECRYFCKYNIMQDTVIEEQNDYIDKMKPDYIITWGDIDLSGYSLISSGDYYDKVLNIVRNYRLYEKNI